MSKPPIQNFDTADSLPELTAAETPAALTNAPLAYENQEFINSPDGRLLRIMSEYTEPMARFRRERIQDTIVFFGSARFIALDQANHQLTLPRKHRLHAARA